jgi:hypothetical protein
MCVFLFLWKSLRVVPERIYNEQQDVIDSQRETIKSLEEERCPKLEVTFEKGNKPYFKSERFTSPISKRDGQIHTNCIRIKNIGLEIIKNVNVKLMEIIPCPEDFRAEGCNLQFMHGGSDVKAKDIQPEGDEFVYIIGYFKPYNKDLKKREMYILHTEEKYSLDIPVKKYDITIKINSDNGGKSIIKNFKFTPTRKNIEDFMEMID